MKRTLLLALCLGALSIAASAANFTLTSNATLNAGSGVTFNSSNNSNTIDFTFSAANITGTVYNNITPDNGPFPPAIGSFFIFKLGTLTLENNEPGSAPGGTFTAQVNLSYSSPLTPINAVLTPVATVTNTGFLGVVGIDPYDTSRDVAFGNGGLLRTWLYTSSSYGSYDTVYVSGFDRTQDLYMKVWLVNAPTSGVPEPGSMALMGSGLLGLSLVARRRFKK